VKNPAVFYAVIALGVIILVVGIIMFGNHFHGKAYAVMALGVVCLVVGVAGMIVARPKSPAR